ncbi:MAG: ATP-binding cassette domain-containing protein [Paludibacteraceae bacterium]|nr:ATP-binding cassette domain-containing protein [Paludibacteraceae bacterium]
MKLQLQNINKLYGKQHVLHNISLTMVDGEIVGLLGPNGAGKSTLMKVIVGLAQAQGTVIVPERIGYLPERNPLYDEMFIREYLLFMARIGKVDNPAERVEILIERVGLLPEAHKRIGQLSKGYRQRVGLAQALLNDPDLLVLDEPTTGLDPNQLVEIRTLIRQLGRDRMVILSTHILQEVREMCDRVVILDHGVIKADKPINEIDNLETLFRSTTDGK